MVYETFLRPRGQVSADLTLEGFVPAHTYTHTHTHTVREEQGRLKPPPGRLSGCVCVCVRREGRRYIYICMLCTHK